MHSIEDYRKAVRTISDTKDALLKIKNSQDDRKRKLHDDYTNKIWELEDQARKLKSEKEETLAAVDKETKDTVQKYWDAVKTCTDIRDRTKCFCDLYHYSMLDVEVKWDKERYSRGYGDIEWKEVPDIIICDDEYKKVGLFIIKNDNSVNCYTLKLQINSLFSSDFLNKVRGENVGIWDGYTLKTAPTEKALREWYEKNKNKIKLSKYQSKIPLEEFISFHEGVEKDYIEALELFKDKNWRRIYWEHRKYYYEEHYSRGTETDEYKGALEALKICDTDDKDLPLLVGEIKHTEGKYEMRRRLG